MTALIKKKFKISRIILFSLLLVTLTGTYSSGHRGYKADFVQPLFEREYEETVMELLRQARKSIYVSMYFIQMSEIEVLPVNQLVNRLIEAHERGVEVYVVLEGGNRTEFINRLNKEVKNRLEDVGIRVRMNSSRTINHVKLIVVDDFISVIGSHNWTLTAFRRNQESSVMIKSADVARDFKRYLLRLR